MEMQRLCNQHGKYMFPSNKESILPSPLQQLNSFYNSALPICECGFFLFLRIFEGKQKQKNCGSRSGSDIICQLFVQFSFRSDWVKWRVIAGISSAHRNHLAC